MNWTSEDNQPYSSWSWWWAGNFLIDGHNNNNFQNGTFSLQFYGGGRVRWDFGDGEVFTGGQRAIQVWPATSTSSLLDGNWHKLSCVRRWSGASSSDLEVWVDGVRIAVATSARRTNMWTSYWSQWAGFPSGQSGWFWGAEKQAAIGVLAQYEDYKGLVDEAGFWSRAKTVDELTNSWANRTEGNEAGLIGWYRFGEGVGASTCNDLNGSNCIALLNTDPSIWSAVDAPASAPVPAGPPAPPAAPTGLSAAAASAGQINLAWIDVVNETGYSIERSVDSQPFAPIASVGLGVVAYSNTGLSASTTYQYRVRASNDAGPSEYSDVVSATTLAPPVPSAGVPGVPENLTGVGVATDRIDLTWTDTEGETGYSVQGSDDGSFFFAIGSVGSGVTSYSDATGLSPSTTYFYRVRALGPNGNSGYSNVASATTLALSVPSTPSNFNAAAVAPDRINLTWTDVNYETGYAIERSAAGATFVALVNLGPGVTSYANTGLTASTAYQYRIRALGLNGDSEFSGIASATTPAPQQPAPVPAAPSNLVANTYGWRSVTLNWSDNSTNESGFRIERSANGNSWTVVASTVMNQTTFTNTGLYYDRLYYYRVRAYNAEGYSAYSNVLSVRTW